MNAAGVSTKILQNGSMGFIFPKDQGEHHKKKSVGKKNIQSQPTSPTNQSWS